MLALYRSGRQAEALEAYQEFRRSCPRSWGSSPVRRAAARARDPRPRPDARPRPRGRARRRCRGGRGVESAARMRRRRLGWLFRRGVVLLALGVVGAIVAVSGGGSAAPAVIPGDSVGAISASGGALRAVVPLGTSPSVAGRREWGRVGGELQRGDRFARSIRANTPWCETIPAGTTPSGIAVAAARCG